MQASKAVIDALNKVLTTELTSINHYFLHARMYRNWGFERLNDSSYKKSIKDMKQADVLIERILMLEGLPNLQRLEALQIGEHVKEMLNCDLSFQTTAIQQLKDAIALSEQEKDYVSRNILSDLLETEENFLDWLETQQSLLHDIGVQNYLQSQMTEED